MTHHSPTRLLSVLIALLFLLSVVPQGLAAPAAPLATTVFINEIHYDNTGTDSGEAIEIAAPSGTSLTGWTVVLYNGNGGASYDTDALGTVAGTCGTYDLYVINYASNGIQNGAPDGMALVNASNTVIQFLSYEGTLTATNGPANGTTSTNIGVSQDGNGAAGQSLQLSGTGTTYTDFTWQGEATSTFGACNTGQTLGGAPVDNPPAVSSTTPANNATGVAVNATITVNFSESVDVAAGAFSLACPAGTAKTFTTAPVLPATGTTSVVLTPSSALPQNTVCTVTVDKDSVTDKDGTPENMTADHTFSFTTASADPCADPFTPIYQIQGSGSSAAVTGAVTTQGVVVGDYEVPTTGSGQLRGFYIQDATGDSNAATSDGIFVYSPGADNVAVGQVVRVAGTAGEYQEQTQISSVTSIVQCATTASVTPVDVTLPVASATALEPFEGMLVRFQQTLYVTEHYQLGRFGQVVLSSGARLRQPTNVALPGDPAAVVQAANNLNRIIVDDDTNIENPDPIKFGRGGNPLSASNTLRGGDTVTGIVGVLTYTYSGNAISGNAYRLRPIGALNGAANFVAANARPAAPSVNGRLRVTAANVLNYFNSFSGCTLGVGGAATDCRGADNQTEFDRQWPKTVANLVGGGADVIGLMEIENDGYDSTSAIQHLVDKLNAATAAGTYAFINPDTTAGVNSLGTDAIKVGLIYKPAKVMPVGATAVLNTTAFVTGGDSADRNRPALAQAFEEVSSGERFVVAVNHLKSKGSACDTPDAGDGQGNCNGVRTNAANALTAWLAGDPTGTADQDTLIMGDLNSYAQENPITAIKGAGYVNLIEDRLGPDAYSYAFDGQWGYLDHALASTTLDAQVAGVEEWHVNADEPSVLDYNTDYKTAGQQTSLYAADQFRTSDHDPVIIGLNLAPNNQGNLADYSAAWHTGDGALRLGNLWQSGGAQSDNDGVVRTAGVNWQVGAGGGSIDVTVTGATGYFSAWIDWNGNNSFADAGELVINNRELAVGTHTVTFDIPAGVTFGKAFNARFRLYAASQTTLLAAGFAPDAAPAPAGGASGGEVEDYTWDFGPNAVGLRSLTAAPLAPAAWPLWAGLAGLLGLAVLRRRR